MILMLPRPKEVKPLDNYGLQVTFESGEIRIYDMSKLITKPFYCKLKNKYLFNTVKVSDITLEWASGEDICPYELYHNSRPITTESK